MPDKIISSFQQRRQLNQAVDELANTTSEQQILESTQEIAANFPSDLIQQVLLKRLDTDSSQLRGGLGHLAVQLPRDEIVPLLRSTTANRQLAAESRITAALILERFLGETVPSALVSDLTHSNEVAFQSLREAIMEGASNRHILLEYAMQMRQNSESVAFMVLDLLERIPPPNRVELLRLIAQDDRPIVRDHAASRLDQLAASGVPGALRALHTLQFCLPSDSTAQIERYLRKHRFSGIRYVPPDPTPFFALLSPADAGGSQSLWFVCPPIQGETDGKLLGVIGNGRLGLLHAFGTDTLSAAETPAAEDIGKLVPVRTDSGSTAVLLRAPWEFARWRLEQLVTTHWQMQPQQPLPEEFRLYADLIWQFDRPAPSADLRHYFVKPDEDTEAEVPPLDDVITATEMLFAHPAMTGWALQVGGVKSAAHTSLSDESVQAVAISLLRDLDALPERTALLQSVDAGLRAQAAWLHIEGSTKQAERAHYLADHLSSYPLPSNPVFVRLVQSSLRVGHRSDLPPQRPHRS